MAKYRKVSKINSGGYGVVYRAVRTDDNEEFAFKELLAGSGDEEKQRFIREVKMQAKLEHPNIVPIVGMNLGADPPWFTMPLARNSLRDELSKLNCNVDSVVVIFLEILKGVGYAHKNNIIHRDLKPENILFFEDEYGCDLVKICDFGLGKRLDLESMSITQSSQNLGSAPYLPPEQAKSFKHVTETADIFSLGKILYEMAAGDHPLYRANASKGSII